MSGWWCTSSTGSSPALLTKPERLPEVPEPKPLPEMVDADDLTTR
jgi:hypothetical protein